MVLGAILAYSAASYYAKKKGIPVEDVFSWSTCPCSSYSSTATASRAVSDDEEDWVDPTYNYCHRDQTNNINTNAAIIHFNHELLLKSNCSDLSIQRNRSNHGHNQNRTHQYLEKRTHQHTEEQQQHRKSEPLDREATLVYR